jgi:hypothetical protein
MADRLYRTCPIFHSNLLSHPPFGYREGLIPHKGQLWAIPQRLADLPCQRGNSRLARLARRDFGLEAAVSCACDPAGNAEKVSLASEAEVDYTFAEQCEFHTVGLSLSVVVVAGV